MVQIINDDDFIHVIIKQDFKERSAYVTLIESAGSGEHQSHYLKKMILAINDKAKV